MIHDLIGTISLMATEEGAPVAWAVMDQKEKTERGVSAVAELGRPEGTANFRCTAQKRWRV